MKKTLLICLSLVLAITMLSGCGHEHEWTEATYESASACTICGEIQGEPLTPDFVKYGITTPLEVGKTYEYTTLSYDDSTEIKGQATVMSYEITDTAGKLQAKEGYECHVLTIHTTFDAATIQKYGAKVNMSFANYYNIALFDDSAPEDSEELSSVVLINGVETPVYVDSEYEFINNPDGSTTQHLDLRIQVPVGYDGMVCGLANPAAQIEEGQHINDVFTEKDYLLFRLDGKTA